MGTEKENVILVTIDSLRADFLGAYDEKGQDLTPNLDSFADEGALFDNAYAQGSYTRSSIPSFFTSTYPWKLKDGGDIGEEETLATALKSAGYNSAFFHSNPFLSRALGYGKGFDVFDDSLVPWNLNLSQKRVRQIGRLFRLLRKTPYLPADKLVNKAVQWLKEAKDPLFLWVHFMDPHGPYQPRRSGYLGKYRAEKLWNKAVNNPEDVSESERDELIDSYRDEVNFTDENVGRLLSSVEDRVEDNLVLITADHGEEFGEHGEYSHNPKPFEELIHVPFLCRYPGIEGRRVKELVSLVDIFPSILDSLGISPRKYELDGRSFLNLLKGKEVSDRDFVISQPSGQQICLRTKKWKYILDGDDRILYDLENDPGESNDLSDERSDIKEKLERKLAENLDNYGSSGDISEILPGGDESEETAKRLEDLGYL
ncbi:MAG: sulfatase [Candidatus Bipolaricaulota bacterium]